MEECLHNPSAVPETFRTVMTAASTVYAFKGQPRLGKSSTPNSRIKNLVATTSCLLGPLCTMEYIQPKMVDKRCDELLFDSKRELQSSVCMVIRVASTKPVSKITDSNTEESESSNWNTFSSDSILESLLEACNEHARRPTILARRHAGASRPDGRV